MPRKIKAPVNSPTTSLPSPELPAPAVADASAPSTARVSSPDDAAGLSNIEAGGVAGDPVLSGRHRTTLAALERAAGADLPTNLHDGGERPPDSFTDADFAAFDAPRQMPSTHSFFLVPGSPLDKAFDLARHSPAADRGHRAGGSWDARPPLRPERRSFFDELAKLVAVRDDYTNHATQMGFASTLVWLYAILPHLNADMAMHLMQVMWSDLQRWDKIALLQESRLSKNDVRQILEKLANDPDPLTSMDAVKALGELKDPAARPVLENLAMKSLDQRVRHNATEALGKLGDKAARPVLENLAMRSRDPGIRFAAAEALAALGFRDIATQALRNVVITHTLDRTCIPYWAIRKLEELRDPSASQVLKKLAIEDPDSHIRSAAISALAALEVKDIFILLKSTALNDPVSDVRISAIKALGELKAPAARPVLENLAMRSRDPYVRLAAAEALVALGLPDTAIRFLEDLATGHQTHRNGLVTRHAMEALVKLKAPSASQILTNFVNQPSDYVDPFVIQALGSLQDSAALPTLEKLAMRSRYSDTRSSAIEALGKLGDKAARPLLEKLAMRSRDPGIRFAAAKALGKLGNPAARPALERLVIHSRDSRFSISAIEALGKLKDPTAWPFLEKLAVTNHNPQVILAVAKALVALGFPGKASPLLADLAKTSHDYSVYYSALAALKMDPNWGKAAADEFMKFYAQRNDSAGQTISATPSGGGALGEEDAPGYVYDSKPGRHARSFHGATFRGSGHLTHRASLSTRASLATMPAVSMTVGAQLASIESAVILGI